MLAFVALIAGTFVSEDLTCIGAGTLAARGGIDAGLAVAACAIGIFLGDLGLWWVGRLGGARTLAWRRVAERVSAGGPERFARWFTAHAPRIIFASRFVPGSRLPLYLAAGACRTSLRVFAVWSGVAVAIWTPLLVGAGARLGEPLAIRLAGWLAAGRVALVLSGCLVFAGWRLAVALTSRRWRQRWLASMSKIWRWEFWPMWLFYAPVGAWTTWLALRHGGFRTITAANPGILDGGVVGESKYAILSRLPQKWIVPSLLLETGETAARVAALSVAMQDRGWSFPLVLKPDVGQRGSGVRLVRTCADAAQYLAVVHAAVIAQPYHAGPCEAGVFYYRRPGEARGRILAVTDKQFPFVEGDGRSTLEDLIWSHPRCRMQARTFLSRLGPRSQDIPCAGVRVPLAIAGNHAQGTLFKEGRHLITPALESAIDAIAQQYDGFFIGRFDIRYREPAAFMAGRDLAIVELNGATAECTNIYDPDRSLAAAYRALFIQWRLVFEIGAANRRAGGVASSTGRLLRLVREHLGTAVPLPVSD
jgi:membrane protein DedA with SNARE-associated domain